MSDFFIITICIVKFLFIFLQNLHIRNGYDRKQIEHMAKKIIQLLLFSIILCCIYCNSLNYSYI